MSVGRRAQVAVKTDVRQPTEGRRYTSEKKSISMVLVSPVSVLLI